MKPLMRQLIGITGSGAIGVDPFDSQTWSGSSRFFFRACQGRGILRRTFGVEAPWYVKYACALANFSRDKVRWRRKFYMDTRYRQSLTSEVAMRIKPADFDADFLQIGAMYDVPAVVRGRSKCFMYSDGNFAMSLKSPYFPAGISRRSIDHILAYEKQVYAGLDMIFTMSDYLRRSFIDDFGIDAGRVVHVGAGCNLEQLPDLDETKAYDNGKLLFIGADFERKGGPDLLKAFSVVRARVPNATLHIVGPKQRVDTASIPGVVWHGFLRKDDPREGELLKDLFRQASIFVMPSIYEPFGIAPMEAMAHAIPCVASNICALPETIQQGVTGELVQCGRWEQLADVLVAMLKYPDRLKSYGIAGRESIQHRCAWPAVIDRMMAAMNGAADDCAAKSQLPMDVALSTEY